MEIWWLWCLGKECVGGAQEPGSEGSEACKEPQGPEIGFQFGTGAEARFPTTTYSVLHSPPSQMPCYSGGPVIIKSEKGGLLSLLSSRLLLEVKVSLSLHHKTLNILLLLDPEPEHLGVAGHLIYDGLAQQSGLDWVL